MDINKIKVRAAIFSVISNTLLVIFKLIAGIAMNSVSVISEAIHSAMDLLASLIAWFSVKTSSKPPDNDHQFGHGKIENISGTVEALLIFVAAIWIIYEAIEKLIHPVAIEKPGWGILVMAISAIINLIISTYLIKVGKETDSIALHADGVHLKTDVYTSVGVSLALIIYYIGSIYFPNLNLKWIDPLIAILVAVWILKAAWDLTMNSAKDLLDAALPYHEHQLIEEIIEGFKPTIKGFYHLKTRKSGSLRFIDVHIEVSGEMSVNESHLICDEIVQDIKTKFKGNTDVLIHIEPEGTNIKR